MTFNIERCLHLLERCNQDEVAKSQQSVVQSSSGSQSILYRSSVFWPSFEEKQNVV